jgi:hypothetical protein
LRRPIGSGSKKRHNLVVAIEYVWGDPPEDKGAAWGVLTVLRTLLFLSLVGAAIYGFLVISGGNTNENHTDKTQNHPVDERLSSWGSYLARSSRQNPQLATSQRPAQTSPQLGDDASQNSKRKSGTGVEMHSEASVSSPTVEDPSSIGSATPTQVATESTTEPQPAKPAPPKANKLHHQSAKPTGGVANASHPFGNWALGR